jgi:lipopolysaccharide biosynthesis glycosyltransferase
MDDDRINPGVVYICDERYHTLTEFAIASLGMHHQTPLKIYFSQVGYSKPASEPLQQYLVDRGHDIEILQLDREGMDLDRLQAVALHPHISDVTLMKAYAIQKAARNHNHIAFIDSDVLVLNQFSLSSSFKFETTAAGVFDFVSYMPFDNQDLIRHTSQSGVSSNYLNAGLLLINSERWLNSNLLSTYLDKLSSHSVHCPYRHDQNGNDPGDCKGADQCAINMMLENDWTPLEFEWNAQKPIRHTATWKKARIRHYTGHRKFLAKSNVNRDWREARLLQRIQIEVGLEAPDNIKYDFGLMFFLDYLKYFFQTIGYKRILTLLSERMNAATTRPY